MAKHKKHKSKKKKAHTHNTSSENSDDEWVEVTGSPIDNEVKGAKEQKIHEEKQWKDFFSDKASLKVREIKQESSFVDVGQSDRELNPYWKDGGCGLPMKKPSFVKNPVVGDGGASWRMKALKRAKERAQEEGRDLQSVIEERWGSMFSFKADKGVKNFQRESDTTKGNLRKWQKSTYAEINSPITDFSPEISSSADVSVDVSSNANELSAKILKAELMGHTQLVQKLKKDLASMPAERCAPSNTALFKNKTQSLTLKQDNRHKRIKQRKLLEYEEMPLSSMFIQEKITNPARKYLSDLSAETSDELINAMNQESRFYRLSTEYTLKKTKCSSMSLDTCQLCFDSQKINKHLIIAAGKHTYLALPKYKSLRKGHCLIVPLLHVGCYLYLEEDSWVETKQFMQSLVEMFRNNGDDCVFFETVISLKSYPHTVLECIPIPNTYTESVSMFFKKALSDCEAEWSLNKKIIDLTSIDEVQRKLPKGLSYFFVTFSQNGNLGRGFGHVIEDEKLFPSYFGKEVLGEMLDLDYHLWRKMLPEDLGAQLQKVMEFSELYKDFDWTFHQ